MKKKKPTKAQPAKPRRRKVPARPKISELPKHLEDFAQAFAAGKNQKEAAKAAGRKPGSGKYMFHRPEVQKRISEIRQQYGTEQVTLRAEKAVREITIDRNDIIMGLADIAQTAESERARVAAWLGLSDIFMLRAKNTRDIKEFYGWTTDELREYAIKGTIPERFRLLVGEGEGAGLGGSPSLRGDKK